ERPAPQRLVRGPRGTRAREHAGQPRDGERAHARPLDRARRPCGGADGGGRRARRASRRALRRRGSLRRGSRDHVAGPEAACGAERVVLSGQENPVLAITVSDGNTLIKVHTDTHLKGIGTSLDTYVDSETNDSEYHFGPSDSFADIVSTHLLVSQSNTPNFLLVTTTKIDLSTSLFVSRGAGTKCTG